MAQLRRSIVTVLAIALVAALAMYGLVFGGYISLRISPALRPQPSPPPPLLMLPPLIQLPLAPLSAAPLLQPSTPQEQHSGVDTRDRSLVYWAPRLKSEPSASASDPASWWEDGLHMLFMSLLSALLSGKASELRLGTVHFLVLSNVDADVLKEVLLGLVTTAIPKLARALLATVLHTWRVPDVTLAGFQSEECRRWVLRGEIPVFPRLPEYARVLYLDTDVFVKRPLSLLFSDFEAHLALAPGEAGKLHIVPETGAPWSQAAYARDDWKWFRSKVPADAVDVENRAAHDQRPFNSGILLFRPRADVLAALTACQDTLRRAPACPEGDQPFFNDYFGSRLLTNWHFFCGQPTAAQLRATMASSMSSADDSLMVGMTAGTSACARHSNRALLFVGSHVPVPVAVEGHTLVHVVFPSTWYQKKPDIYRLFDAYFPAALDDTGAEIFHRISTDKIQNFAELRQSAKRSDYNNSTR